jgi:hypothetical protein
MAKHRGQTLRLTGQIIDLVEPGRLPQPSLNELLPTPTATNMNDGENLTTWQERRERVKQTAQSGSGFGMPLSVAARLLPTPTTQESSGNCRDYYGDLLHALKCDCLRSERKLLPTPTTQDGSNTGGPSQANRNTPPLNWVAVAIASTDDDGINE